MASSTITEKSDCKNAFSSSVLRGSNQFKRPVMHSRPDLRMFNHFSSTQEDVLLGTPFVKDRLLGWVASILILTSRKMPENRLSNYCSIL